MQRLITHNNYYSKFRQIKVDLKLKFVIRLNTDNNTLDK